MARPRDPTLGKDNFRMRQIRALMQHSWSAFRETKEYDQR